VAQLTKALKDKRGVSLIEAIVAVLIFVVLSATIVSVIVTSLQVSRAGLTASQAMQDATNAITKMSSNEAIDDGTVTFTLPGDSDDVDISIGVYVFEHEGFTAFRP